MLQDLAVLYRRPVFYTIMAAFKTATSLSSRIEVRLLEQVETVVVEEEDMEQKKPQHRRGKKRPRKSYYEMTEKERWADSCLPTIY